MRDFTSGRAYALETLVCYRVDPVAFNLRETMKLGTSGKWIVAGALAASSCFAAERNIRAVRASTIRGATVSFESGGAAGTVQDVVLDPQTGCARFVILETEGRTVAAPYRILRSTGPGAYTAVIDRQRLIDAPVVNVDRIEEFSDPAFTQRIYSYYGVGPETDISVREREGIRGGREGGAVREGRGLESGRGTTAAPGGGERAIQGGQSPARAQSVQSPSPVGERSRKHPRSKSGAHMSPSPSSIEGAQSPGAIRERTGPQSSPSGRSLQEEGSQERRGSERQRDLNRPHSAEPEFRS